MASTAAKVLSMLPAYLITIATISPPATWTATTTHVLGQKPCSAPCAAMCARSVWNTVSVWSGSVKMASWTLRIQIEVEPRVNMSSR